MTDSEVPYLNPVHAMFPFADLMRPEITLSRFFELFDTIDAVDRDALLGLTAYALGVDVKDIGDEEAEQQARYQQFKKACGEIHAMDHVILRGIVQEILNMHQRWSDSSHTDEAIKTLTGFVEFSKARGATDEELEKWRIKAEQKQVQRKSDLEVSRRRYNLFCENVVRPLILLDR